MIISGHGVNQFTVPKPNLEPSYELSYLLGVLKGDACLYKSRNRRNKPWFIYMIQLGVRDKEFAEYFLDNLEKIFSRRVKIIQYYDDRNKLFYRVAMRSKIFYEWYVSKSEDEIFEIGKSYPSAFIKGVFDSEGNLSYNKNYPLLRICSSNSRLIQEIQLWLKKFYDIISKISVRSSKEQVINGRLCMFKKDIYILKISNKRHIEAYFKHIGTSISRKQMR